jgi:hypothetical protein
MAGKYIVVGKDDKLLKAVQTLSFWASCFDYANYSGKNPLYGGEDGCRKAEDLLIDFIEDTTKNKATSAIIEQLDSHKSILEKHEHRLDSLNNSICELLKNIA